MADILIVAATSMEIGFLSKKLKNSKPGTIHSVSKGLLHNFDILITGPGIAATTYYLTKAIGKKNYSLAINLGICGSLNPEIKPVRVLAVKADQFADFGSEDGSNFIDAFGLGFLKANQFPFRNKKLHSSSLKFLKCLQAIPSSEAVTVQKSTGSQKTRKKLIEQFGYVVESMEGAAFFYVCNLEKVKCFQIRAVSNVAEKRNRKAWKINEAINALEGVTGLVLMELETKKI